MAFVLALLLGESIYRGRRLRFGTLFLLLVILVLPVVLFGKVLLRVFEEEVVESAMDDLLDAPRLLRTLMWVFVPVDKHSNLPGAGAGFDSVRWFIIPIGIASIL
jgi:hypothetical protein